LPFSRFSVHDIRQRVINKEIVESISATTIREWLHEDRIRPWTSLYAEPFGTYREYTGATSKAR
jgi:hypothetical protein